MLANMIRNGNANRRSTRKSSYVVTPVDDSDDDQSTSFESTFFYVCLKRNLILCKFIGIYWSERALFKVYAAVKSQFGQAAKTEF